MRQDTIHQQEYLKVRIVHGMMLVVCCLGHLLCQKVELLFIILQADCVSKSADIQLYALT